jgi:hypothetical protein
MNVKKKKYTTLMPDMGPRQGGPGSADKQMAKLLVPCYLVQCIHFAFRNNSKEEEDFKSKGSEKKIGKTVSVHLYKYIVICSLYTSVMFILVPCCLSLHSALLAGQIRKKYQANPHVYYCSCGCTHSLIYSNYNMSQYAVTTILLFIQQAM